ncbi:MULTISPECIES: thioredoxin family protein [Thermotoga]|uniref:Thioredoxin-related protein-like protein n=2 Tax=Thermotoga petrophila TaxID=93929 RepID=A5IN36_THEP1|nr:MULTISPECIES: thioredoxin fold domain-containing protein [Thermotoga]KUK22309.1 MAG: Thioredoxin-related protein-like protein [Thermotoga petrophila]MBZ4661086.1 thioredoxin-related protein-like protein [Thermotoga sp.]ABQ47609.1 Thioredoxin-related protein-like protein [Thermotoga petrophila RKU-1]ACB10004.1 thioredoxin-related protein-like protein [Thermotoga sp. RQ2]AIY88906.1 thioredoxin-like protein [Thermotoga sp. Cell2]
MKRFLIIAILALSVISLALTLDDAYRLANITQRKLIMMFSSPTCYYCNLFKKEVFPKEDFQEILIPNFVFVELYATDEKTTLFAKEVLGEESVSYRDLFAGFGVRGTPTFFFFKGKEGLGYLPGYVDKDNFIKILKYVAQELKEDFQTYLKKDDPFVGEPLIIEISKEDADFVLKKDKNAVKVDTVPNEVRRDRIYVTDSPDVAKTLQEKGALRVLLVK